MLRSLAADADVDVHPDQREEEEPHRDRDDEQDDTGDPTVRGRGVRDPLREYAEPQRDCGVADSAAVLRAMNGEPVGPGIYGVCSEGLPAPMDSIRFRATIRYWNPAKASGLAVMDIPDAHVATFGGLKQQRVRGTLAGADFASNVMPAGGGHLALSVSKAMMSAGGVGIGDEADVEVTGIGRE